MILVFSVGLTSAHVPRDAENNTGLNSAEVIDNPTKSWAIYSQLTAQQNVSYFQLNMEKGERLFVQLFVTTRAAEQQFLPEFALMGPGLTNNGTVPNYVETIGNVSVMQSSRSESEYEPFGPSHQIMVAVVDIPVPQTGIYFVAVYSQTGSGHFGLAIGSNESFTLSETILNPINVIQVYRWMGESWLLIIFPYLATFGIGLVLIKRYNGLQTLEQWIVYLIGLVFLSSSVSFIWQTIYNASQSQVSAMIFLSAAIALVQTLIASGIIIVARKPVEDRKLPILQLLILSIIGLFVWTGLIVGPILGILTAIGIFGTNQLKL